MGTFGYILYPKETLDWKEEEDEDEDEEVEEEVDEKNQKKKS